MHLSFSLLKINSVIVFLLCSFSCFATWHQGSAKKSFNAFNFDNIRTETIKRAIANAAMKDRSYIQVEDIVLDGLLQSSKTLLRSEGQIRRVEIIAESIDGDTLTVTVKADIKSLISCEKDAYAKSLLITQFPILKPMQAVDGALFDLGIQASKRFEMQLNSQPKVSVNLLHKSALISDTSDEKERYLKEVGAYLATEHDSQFILFGAIRDISLFEQVKEQLLIDDVLLRRNFTVELYLYDAIRDNMLLQKNYHGEANWQYESNHIVDTNNSVFWRMDYGRSVLHTINSAVIDISDALNCQQSLSQIIHQENDLLVINIGNKQGVKVGDEFELVSQRLITGANGNTYAIHSVDHLSTLSVIQVSAKSAVLKSDSFIALPENQLLNLVTPKSIF